MKVPLLDLHAQYNSIKDDIQKSLDKVYASQHFIMGPQVAELEKAIATYTRTPHAIACASGSDALVLALMASDLQAGQGVITVPFTFFSTVSAITRLGGRPFFVDIDPTTYNISPQSLRTFLEKECIQRGNATFHRASNVQLHSLIPVHLFGQCADMDPLLELAREFHLLVIEDAAQAIGATYRNRPAGSMGDFGCFSFFPSKNLGCMGDGGMVTTRHDAYADKLKLLRLHGSRPKYYHKVVGLNSRLDTIQAAILLVKLPHLDAWSAKRRQNAAFYTQAFQDLSGFLATPVILPSNQSVVNQYCIRLSRRDILMEYLKTHEIGTEIYYPLPLHLQECFQFLKYRSGDFPVSEQISKEILALPIYPELTPSQLEHVSQTLHAFAEDKLAV